MVVLSSSISAKVSKMSCQEYKWQCLTTSQHNHPHNNTVSRNKKFCVDQVTPPPPPRGTDKGWGRTGGGDHLLSGIVCPVASLPKLKFNQKLLLSVCRDHCHTHPPKPQTIVQYVPATPIEICAEDLHVLHRLLSCIVCPVASLPNHGIFGEFDLCHFLFAITTCMPLFSKTSAYIHSNGTLIRCVCIHQYPTTIQVKHNIVLPMKIRVKIFVKWTFRLTQFCVVSAREDPTGFGVSAAHRAWRSVVTL